MIDKGTGGGRIGVEVRQAGRREEMAQGTLEVLLVGAKGLENTDYLSTQAVSMIHDRLVRLRSGKILQRLRAGLNSC